MNRRACLRMFVSLALLAATHAGYAGEEASPEADGTASLVLSVPGMT